MKGGVDLEFSQARWADAFGAWVNDGGLDGFLR